MPEQMLSEGLRVRGALHAADASSATEVPLYTDDGAVREIAANERLIIDAMTFNVDTEGDSVVFFDLVGDQSVTDGGVIERGNFAAKGGVVPAYPCGASAPMGPPGVKVYAKAQGGVDVTLKGRLVQVLTKTGPVGAAP